MQSVTFQLKVITPTLMGGGFGQNDGIRPSEIKGMMRYWFRAAAGSVVGNDIKALKSLEEKIFGSQERKSPFRMVINNRGLKYLNDKSPEFQFSNKMNGLIYLGIGNVLFKYDKNTRSFKFNDEKINIIAPNSTFKIRFLFNPSLNLEIKKLITLSFYLATALGSFGLRARRGFGSWQIEDIITNVESLRENLEKLKLKNYDLNNIKANIDKAEKILRNLSKTLDIRIQNSLKNSTKLDFTNFINYELEQIKTNKTEWKELLEDLGAYYRYFRVNPEAKQLEPDDFDIYLKDKNGNYLRDKNGKKIKKHTKDYDEILNRNKREKELYNPIFGLNIIYKKDISVNLKSNNETLRRASPLFISIKEINKNLAINLFVSISTNFKSDKQEVKVEFKKSKFPVKVENLKDYKTIIDFIEKLDRVLERKNGN